VTKGALYYHFPNKKALGMAVIDNIILPHFRKHWFEPLRNCEEPLNCIQRVLMEFSQHAPPEAMELGCPLNNLAQEMSPIDEDFRLRLEHIFGEWRSAIVDALERGREDGQVRADTDPEKVAMFIIAANEGAASLAKSARDLGVLETCCQSLAQYLETLRPAGVTPARQ
jgi:AcrR family transcriptional regulator